MVLEKLPGLLSPILGSSSEVVLLFTAILAILVVFVSIWWLMSERVRARNQLIYSAVSKRPDRQDVAEEDNNYNPLPSGEKFEHIPFDYHRSSTEKMLERSNDFYELMQKRRSIRKFSSDPVPWSVLETIVKTAGTSPSGANAQPWTYVVVSDQRTKEEIRRIVELEEEINYDRRMGKKWVMDLKRFNVNWEKPYLTEAPVLILVFKQVYSIDKNTGMKKDHYYQEISVSLSVGILLAAIQNAGLVTLTSTPLNCGPGLRSLLKRPEEEKLMLLLPVGFPAEDATVPDITRKDFDSFVVRI